MRYLEEYLDECQSIFENSKIEFNNAIRQLHYDLNIFDSALDPVNDVKNSDVSEVTELFDEPESVEKTSHPAWAKKVFRDIVKETHPDHFPKDLRKSRKKNLTEIYEKTIKSYNKKSYAELIESAFRLGIEIEGISKEQSDTIKKKITFIENEISVIRNSLYWQWAHANDEMKQSILKKFVDMRGWTSTSASRKRSRKGSGTHPGKSISWARKKFKNVSEIHSCDEEEK